MRSLGPYRLDRTLGTCQVGSVWAATDAAGGRVTVAVLDAVVASDPRWREAFSATANMLAQNGGLPALHADFTAASPWVAVAGGPGPDAAQIFTALGQECRPGGPEQKAPLEERTDQAGALPGATVALPVIVQPVPTRAVPVQGTAERVAPATASPVPVSPAVISPALVSGGAGPGGPVSGGPISGRPFSGGPISGGPVSSGGLWNEPAVPAPQTELSRRRASMWIGVIALLLLLPGGGGVIIATTLRPTAGTPVAKPSKTAKPVRPPTSTPAAIRPGIEPPIPGDWPEWPTFAATEKTKTQTLDNLGFSFRTPQNWECTRVGSTATIVRYRCGVMSGGTMQIGGEVLVRPCPAPCDDLRRAEMRTREDAYGLQWVRSGSSFTHWAADVADIDGKPRYGLVFISYFSSVRNDESPNRQLVFRMNGPTDRADDLRKVANDIRDVLF